MRVYEMSARFSRKVQVKQFEPAEAEFEMKVELDETDDPKEVRGLIMQEVRDAVTQAFQGKAGGKGAKVEVASKTTPEETNVDSTNGKVDKPKPRGRPPGSKNKSKESKPLVAEEEKPLDLDPPADNVVDLKPNGKDEKVEEDEPELTLAQVKTLMNKVTGDGVKVPKVRELLSQFGVSSTTELDPSAYAEFYSLLSEIQSEELEL